MTTPWVRLWREMPNDPKWRTVAKKAGAKTSDVVSVFITMMTSADESGELIGWDAEDVASGLDLEAATVAAIHAAMQGKVLEGNRLIGWEKRQPKREDDSRDRVRAFRERKREETPCNADVTHGNAPEPDPEKTRDKQLPSEQEPARESEVGKNLVELGLGRGGVPTAVARRKVCAQLAIADADPLVRLYEAWAPSRRAKDPDALFIRTAEKFFRKARAEVKAACQPLANEPIPIVAPTVRASPQLANSRLMRMN